ncbi:hypothetical protein BN871_IL_00020 [Paenibacillus sp. P22]|nr:hypothetical protein BN871_IL_00020 [Paenibacillus sp. P22]
MSDSFFLQRAAPVQNAPQRLRLQPASLPGIQLQIQRFVQHGEQLAGRNEGRDLQIHGRAPIRLEGHHDVVHAEASFPSILHRQQQLAVHLHPEGRSRSCPACRSQVLRFEPVIRFGRYLHLRHRPLRRGILVLRDVQSDDDIVPLAVVGAEAERVSGSGIERGVHRRAECLREVILEPFGIDLGVQAAHRFVLQAAVLGGPGCIAERGAQSNLVLHHEADLHQRLDQDGCEDNQQQSDRDRTHSPQSRLIEIVGQVLVMLEADCRKREAHRHLLLDLPAPNRDAQRVDGAQRHLDRLASLPVRLLNLGRVLVAGLVVGADGVVVVRVDDCQLDVARLFPVDRPVLEPVESIVVIAALDIVVACRHLGQIERLYDERRIPGKEEDEIREQHDGHRHQHRRQQGFGYAAHGLTRLYLIRSSIFLMNMSHTSVTQVFRFWLMMATTAPMMTMTATVIAMPLMPKSPDSSLQNDCFLTGFLSMTVSPSEMNVVIDELENCTKTAAQVEAEIRGQQRSEQCS